MSIRPAWLQCIATYQIEPDKLETFVGVAHVWTYKLPEDIRFTAASRAWARAPKQFEFQKRFGAVVPGNGQFVSDLLDVAWLKSHGQS